MQCCDDDGDSQVQKWAKLEGDTPGAMIQARMRCLSIQGKIYEVVENDAGERKRHE